VIGLSQIKTPRVSDMRARRSNSIEKPSSAICLTVYSKLASRVAPGYARASPNPYRRPHMMIVVVYLLLIVLIIAGMWKVFEKAGQPGWAAIVPFYNAFVLTTKIAQKEILWFVLLFIPLVNIVAAIIVSIEVAKKFGKGAGFGVGLALLGFIFYPILGFGDAQYEGRGAHSLDDEKW